MKPNVMSSLALVSVVMALGPALAQNAAPKAGGAGMEAPAGGGAGGEMMKPKAGEPAGGKPIPGAQGGTASPGMKPTPEKQAEPTPGQRKAGENAGVEPEPKAGKADDAAKTGEPAPAPKAAEQKDRPKPAGAARPAPRINEAQQTRIRETIRTVNVHPVHVDFAIRVGIGVPRTVVLEPLPPAIISYVPEYEGFRFFVVPGQIVVVDPVTFEIVAVLPL